MANLVARQSGYRYRPAVTFGGTMSRIAFAAIVMLALAGCTTNHSIGSLQLNFAAEPLPQNYAETAAQLVSGRETISPLLISEPQTMVGESVFSPQRWYVCIRGIRPEGQPSELIPLQRRIENWISPPLAKGQYDVVVIFNRSIRPTVVEGYDSRLCQNSEFNLMSV